MNVEVTTRKKRRVFRWVFLAIQILFVIWLIAGIAATHGDPNHCLNQGGAALGGGQAGVDLCSNATDTGRAIGIGMVIALWVVVDVIVGGTYAVMKLAGRKQSA
jgi:hypothetical protein